MKCLNSSVELVSEGSAKYWTQGCGSASGGRKVVDLVDQQPLPLPQPQVALAEMRKVAVSD